MAELVSKLKMLAQMRSVIFQTSWNPTSQRTGAKYLRKRLRGPAMNTYYPAPINISNISKMMPELDLYNENDCIRLEDIHDRRVRGKGAPVKIKEKGEGKRANRRK